MATRQARQKVVSGDGAKVPAKMVAQPVEDVVVAGPMLLTVRQAAERIGVSYTTLYPHVMHGTLPSVALGRSKRAERMVLASALGTFLQALWEEQRPFLGIAG